MKKYFCWIPIFGYLYIMYKFIISGENPELLPTNRVTYWITSIVQGLSIVVLLVWLGRCTEPQEPVKVITPTIVDTTRINEKSEEYYIPTVSPSVGSTSTNSK